MNTSSHTHALIFLRLFVALLMVMGVFQTFQPVLAQPDTLHLIGPAGSGAFGKTVTALPNGNFVVTDPQYSNGGLTGLGAVYLYNGASKALLSTLKGSASNDQIGSAGITLLQDGNFLVSSPLWNNGATGDAGAVTWCSASTGCPAVISAANSLVGSHANDQIGSGWIMTFSDTVYIIPSPQWDNGTASNAGALTICRITSICNGPISTGNSLLGSSAEDKVGQSSIYSLQNGRFAIATPTWKNGAAANAGAVTYCSSVETCRGLVSSGNSLVGSTLEDRLGQVTLLIDGDYLVRSPMWDEPFTVDVGAVTYCSASSGCVGPVDSSNSLIGSRANDQLGSGGVIQLDNGRYVVTSPEWDRGGIANAGAATWCGTFGCTGHISESNSLVGSTANDRVGMNAINLRFSGDYLVLSPFWDNGGIADVGAGTWCSNSSGCQGEITPANSLTGSQAGDGQEMSAISSFDVNNFMIMFPDWDNGTTVNAGAVVWCPANSGCTGEIDPATSLVGSHANDQVGLFGTEMGAGKYILSSYNWNGTAAGAGAVTLCQQLNGCAGIVSHLNSLVGSTAGDHVGDGSLSWDSNSNLLFSHNNWHYGTAANAGALTFCKNLASCTGPVSTDNSLIGTQENDQVGRNFQFLPNGNYITNSTDWHNVGAITFCNGASGCKGPVSTDNSLTGSHAGDQVGIYPRVLQNGNYVVGSPNWDNGAVSDVGAVTFCSATTGCKGTISSANSLIGSVAQDYVGNQMIAALPNNDYLVFSPWWDNNATTNAGNLAWCDGVKGCQGSAALFPRSVKGTSAEGGFQITYAFNPVHQQVIVGRPADNRVTILDAPIQYISFGPIIRRP